MNTTDELMNKDPLGLSGAGMDPRELDRIIAYLRQARQSYLSGVKPKKTDNSPKIDLVQLGLVQELTIKRRKL